MPPSKTNARFKFAQFFLIFALVYVGSRVVLTAFFPEQFGPESKLNGSAVVLRPVDATVKGGHHPLLTLVNKTDGSIVLSDRCPMPPVEVWFAREGEQMTELKTGETVLPCKPLTEVGQGERVTIDLAPWKYSLFSEYGKYEMRLKVALAQDAEPETFTAQFSIHESGPITKLFRTFITKPFLNFLIFVASFLPDHNLGVAIIVLTLLVKFALFFPTQHSMEGQKKLQKLQPKLDEIKKKYKDNPEQMNKEVMKLWKEHGVNPMQSCLPMLIQFPILIGLFFVIRDGSTLELSRHLVYPFYSNLSWGFGTMFLGLDLVLPSKILFPPLLAILQFIQMKLSFAIAKRKSEKDGQEKKKEHSQQEMQQRMMLYGLPVMIGVFAFQFPAAVSLYWGVSTVFAIGQQIVVNRKELR